MNKHESGSHCGSGESSEQWHGTSNAKYHCAGLVFVRRKIRKTQRNTTTKPQHSGCHACTHRGKRPQRPHPCTHMTAARSRSGLTRAHSHRELKRPWRKLRPAPAHEPIPSLIRPQSTATRQMNWITSGPAQQPNAYRGERREDATSPGPTVDPTSEADRRRTRIDQIMLCTSHLGASANASCASDLLFTTDSGDH